MKRLSWFLVASLLLVGFASCTETSTKNESAETAVDTIAVDTLAVDTLAVDAIKVDTIKVDTIAKTK